MEQVNENKLLAIKDIIKTEESRINYLRGLIRIAECDENKSPAEEGYICRIAEIIGASPSVIWQAEQQEESDDFSEINFKTKQEKSLFLIQALYMCWIDNDYSDAEREAIITLGINFGIDQTEIESIESWVKQGIDWMKAGSELIGLK